jgi:hypothetical protein
MFDETYGSCVTVTQPISVTSLRMPTLSNRDQYPEQAVHQTLMPLIIFRGDIWKKNVVHASAADTTEELLQRVRTGCTSVPNAPGTF